VRSIFVKQGARVERTGVTVRIYLPDAVGRDMTKEQAERLARSTPEKLGDELVVRIVDQSGQTIGRAGPF
jgi:hypothetical protein